MVIETTLGGWKPLPHHSHAHARAQQPGSKNKNSHSSSSYEEGCTSISTHSTARCSKIPIQLLKAEPQQQRIQSEGQRPHSSSAIALN
ncbi:hypothetical protein Nepgr_005284 [Nepenthes gracilis]|uniref:Uncharacterized protein n=1 Tax=Nepenthes gracilis TaxID=150966 RepID=A0AAD3S2X0_NEPGR|nr:hypothetical protein Nepgr_005284 [Nepenthes gracilis]